MKKVGILGGTFNPVHNEHLSLAISAVKELNLDKLIVMPTCISPHKTLRPAGETDRLNMLKLAFEGQEKITVSDYEITKGGKSYTYQTVEHYKELFGSEIFFICGGDMLTDFKTWKYPERILSACTLAVFDREGVFTDYENIEKYFKETFKKSFVKLKYVGKDASSTKIRVYSEFGLPLDGIAPKGVEEYIKENRLYSGDKYTEYIKKALPPKRIKHTADVVTCALLRAKELGLDENKVKLACTLHDCAKYLDHTKVQGFALPDGVPLPVVHAFLGAFVAEHYLGVTDSEVLDAIRYHTSGKAEMSTLAKLVFVADMVEEGRTYDGVDKLRHLYRTADFEQCFFNCLEEEVLHLLNKKQSIFVETLNAYDYYKKGERTPKK